MKKIIQWLVPKEHKFYEMLSEQSNNAMEAAKELKNFISQYADFGRNERKSRAKIIKDIESKGDVLSHELTKLLKGLRNIDKADIKQAVILLDDIIDHINAAASRAVIFSIERIDEHTSKLIEKINEIVAELNDALHALKKSKSIEAHVEKINSLEKEIDEIYQNALSDLFHYYKNPIDIMKYREIYEHLESIADKCKKVANSIAGIRR